MTEHARDRVERWVDLPAKAEEVWDLIGPFGSLADWHPLIAACEVVEIDGETHRHVTLRDGELLLEKLTEAAPHTLRYELVDGPIPVTDYRATLTCFPEGDGCRVYWSSTYEAEDPQVDELVAGLYEAGLQALAERFGG